MQGIPVSSMVIEQCRQGKNGAKSAAHYEQFVDFSDEPASEYPTRLKSAGSVPAGGANASLSAVGYP